MAWMGHAKGFGCVQHFDRWRVGNGNAPEHNTVSFVTFENPGGATAPCLLSPDRRAGTAPCLRVLRLVAGLVGVASRAVQLLPCAPDGYRVFERQPSYVSLQIIQVG